MMTSEIQKTSREKPKDIDNAEDLSELEMSSNGS